MAKTRKIAECVNVRINLGFIKDDVFVKKISSNLDKLEKNAADKTSKVIEIVKGYM